MVGYAHLWQFDDDPYMRISVSEETPERFKNKIENRGPIFRHTYHGSVELDPASHIPLSALDFDVIENSYKSFPAVKSLVDRLELEHIKVLRPPKYGLYVKGDVGKILTTLQKFRSQN